MRQSAVKICISVFGMLVFVILYQFGYGIVVKLPADMSAADTPAGLIGSLLAMPLGAFAGLVVGELCLRPRVRRKYPSDLQHTGVDGRCSLSGVSLRPDVS